MPAPTLYVLTGPTAVGKTQLALGWAERYNAEILSCDALLFYRGMNIGTAKPTLAERASIRHHAIDLVEPRQAFSIEQYIEVAHKAIEDATARGKRILITGGSGFYLKAFFGPVVDSLEISADVREEVVQTEALGLQALREAVLKLNPDGTGDLDLQNPARLRNALARCLVSGETYLTLRARFEARPGPFSEHEVQYVLLNRHDEELRQRISQRVAQMINDGLADEVAALRNLGLESNPSAARAIGYRETLQFLDGKLDDQTWHEAICHDTWKLVRKQRMWFRTQLPEPRLRLDLSTTEADPGALFAV